MASNPVSGFDMQDTIAWYESAKPRLPPPIIYCPLPCPIEDRQFIGMPAEYLHALYSLFPEHARARSILRKIAGKPAMWFHRDAKAGQQISTGDVQEALS